MAATKIDGTAIAKNIREGLKAEIEKVQVTNPRFKPNLVIFQGMYTSRWNGKLAMLMCLGYMQSETARILVSLLVDSIPCVSQANYDAGTYVRMKLKAAEEVGFV